MVFIHEGLSLRFYLDEMRRESHIYSRSLRDAVVGQPLQRDTNATLMAVTTEVRTIM